MAHYGKEDTSLPQSRNGEYFFRLNHKSRNLNLKQYIYYLGPYRYNWHYDMELLLILEGSIEVNYGGQTVYLEEDDLLLLTPNIGHASLAKTAGSKAMLIRLNPDYLADFYNPISGYVFSGHTTEQTRNQDIFVQLRGMMAHMFLHLSDQDPLNQLRVEYELNKLLYILFKAFPPVRRPQNPYDQKSLADEDLVRKIILYIEDHYKEKITLKDLGRLCSYNLSYLSLFFKKHVGINFYEYLMRIRLREATLELCSESCNILDIANRNGFADLKSFNQNFKKVFNKSPREYRQQLPDEIKGMTLSEKRQFVSLQDNRTQEKLLSYMKNFHLLFVTSQAEIEHAQITEQLDEIERISVELRQKIQALKNRV